RCQQHHATTNRICLTVKPATTAGTTATAAAFPATTAVVAGCGWLISHHRRGGAYTNPDLLLAFPCMGLSAAKPPSWWWSDDGIATTAAPCGVGLPFLSTAHAKIDVFKRKITLRVGKEKIIFKSAKPASNLIRKIYILILRERMELDLEARRDQVDDLMATIEEGKVIEEFRARNNARMDKLEYQGNKIVEALMNIPIFVESFSILTDFAILEDIDAYRDEGTGDVIFGEPFLREVGINAKRFKGMITICNGKEEVTYQMVRPFLRFKHHTNEQCNKIPPLLKVSKEDTMNGISHSYQKLKSFYKGVLNLGPEYVRDERMEEWLTCGHISMHET
nr:homeodomain-like protein [Tanacetum cinerariifolium]